MPFIGLNEAILVGGAILALILGPKKLLELAGALGKIQTGIQTSMQEANNVAEDTTSSE
jgi:Sec-independent protein translocase protein TatA